MPYDSAWMYHAADTWASSSDGLKFLRGAQPTILSLPTIDLSLPSLPRIAGPPSLGPPASAKLLNTFNPAIARAPRKLCPRCAYVVAMRVDGLHQVNALCRPCGVAVAAHTLRLLRAPCSRPPCMLVCALGVHVHAVQPQQPTDAFGSTWSLQAHRNRRLVQRNGHSCA